MVPNVKASRYLEYWFLQPFFERTIQCLMRTSWLFWIYYFDGSKLSITHSITIPLNLIMHRPNNFISFQIKAGWLHWGKDLSSVKQKIRSTNQCWSFEKKRNQWSIEKSHSLLKSSPAALLGIKKTTFFSIWERWEIILEATILISKWANIFCLISSGKVSKNK